MTNEQRDQVREALYAAQVALEHAGVFIASREKMHPDGQALHMEAAGKVVDALSLLSTPPAPDTDTTFVSIGGETMVKASVQIGESVGAPSTEEVEEIRARAEAGEQDDQHDGWTVRHGWKAHTDRATLLSKLDALQTELVAERGKVKGLEQERDALRQLCREAADLYGNGGTFPIRGVMSIRLVGASLGNLALAVQNAGGDHE